VVRLFGVPPWRAGGRSADVEGLSSCYSGAQRGAMSARCESDAGFHVDNCGDYRSNAYNAINAFADPSQVQCALGIGDAVHTAEPVYSSYNCGDVTGRLFNFSLAPRSDGDFQGRLPPGQYECHNNLGYKSSYTDGLGNHTVYDPTTAAAVEVGLSAAGCPRQLVNDERRGGIKVPTSLLHRKLELELQIKVKCQEPEKLLSKMDGQHEAGLAVENLRIGNAAGRKTRVSIRKSDFAGSSARTCDRASDVDRFYQCDSEVVIRCDQMDRATDPPNADDTSSSGSSDSSLRGRERYGRPRGTRNRQRHCSPSLSVHRQFHRGSDRRSRRRSRDKVKWIKPEKFNGHGSFETCLVQFENCAAYNEWNLTDKAAHRRWSLMGTAAQLLWGSEHLPYEELLDKLKRRFSSKGMEEKFQTELRCRRRNNGESLRELAHDIRRLMTLAYPGEQSSLSEHIARDAFLSALGDPDFELKIREHDQVDLDDALQTAQRYEVFKGAAQSSAATRSRRNRSVAEVQEDQVKPVEEVCNNTKPFASAPATRNSQNYSRRRGFINSESAGDSLPNGRLMSCDGLAILRLQKVRLKNARNGWLRRILR